MIFVSDNYKKFKNTFLVFILLLLFVLVFLITDASTILYHYFMSICFRFCLLYVFLINTSSKQG